MDRPHLFAKRVKMVPVTQWPAVKVEVAIRLMYRELIFQVSIKYIHVLK